MSLKNVFGFLRPLLVKPLSSVQARWESTQSPSQEGLMSFFDKKDNWGVSEVRVGRSWRKDELRIKSNQDLHKLWYVLLKERNMLLTMEEEYLRKYERFPNPERIDKIKESMVNLEDVVRERNEAYYMLETGETGERPGRLTTNQIGMHYFYKTSEHFIPEESNNSWFRKRKFDYNRKECAKFLLLLNEKRFLEKKRERNAERNAVMAVLRRFPDVNIEDLKAEYPNINVEKLKRYKRARGHCTPE